MGNLTAAKRRYNRALSSARQCVERAIGQLKGRFRRLLNIYSEDLSHICQLITAACVLHNICIYEDDETQSCLYDENHPNRYPRIFGDGDAGVARRNEILQNF